MRHCATTFDVEKIKIQLKEKENESTNPDFWEKPEEAKKILKIIEGYTSQLKKIEALFSKIGEVEVSYEFFQQGEMKEHEVEGYYSGCLDMLKRFELEKDTK